jgi:hypothetical protein
VRLRPWIDKHDIFRFSREPLARGVAIGFFCGLIPGPFQVIGALLACAWWRGNVVAAAAATAYTNPLTIVPLYILAFNIGAFFLPGEHSLPPWEAFREAGWIEGLMQWVQALGWPLAVGLPVMGLWFATIAYALVQIAWLSPVLARARRVRNARKSS